MKLGVEFLLKTTVNPDDRKPGTTELNGEKEDTMS